jgi:hypothetical protein
MGRFRSSIERRSGVDIGDSAERLSRDIVVYTEVLLDRADALQQVIDFFCDLRLIPSISRLNNGPVCASLDSGGGERAPQLHAMFDPIACLDPVALALTLARISHATMRIGA